MNSARHPARHPLRRRPGLVLAGAMAIALSACGGAGGPEALTLTAGGGNAKNAALGSAEGMSSDAAMTSLPFWNVEYRVEGALPDLGDTARAWKLKTSKASTVLPKARKVAAELGIKDKFVAQPDKMSHNAGSTDGTGPSMWVWTGGTEASWSYYGGNAMASRSTGSAASSCVTSEDGTTTCKDPGIAEVKPPRNLPSKNEALARATEVVEAAGENVEAFTMTATKDEWGTYVQATMKVGGMDGPFGWWFGFGEDKALTSASGVFVSFVKGSEYPLVPAADAVERLTSPQFGYGMPGLARSTEIVGTDDSTEAVTSDEPATKTAPVDPGQEPETKIVPITGARLALMPAYLADGTVFVLPAYTFTNSDGDVGTVFAIEDRYLKFDDGSDTPAPPPGETPVKPDDGGSNSGSNSGSGGGSGTSGSSGKDDGTVDGSGGADPVSPGDDGVVDEPIPQDLADKLVGLTEEAAMDVVKREGWIARVSERDGEQYMLTADYVTNRVNLTIDKGVVTKVVVG